MGEMAALQFGDFTANLGACDREAQNEAGKVYKTYRPWITLDQGCQTRSPDV